MNSHSPHPRKDLRILRAPARAERTGDALSRVRLQPNRGEMFERLIVGYDLRHLYEAIVSQRQLAECDRGVGQNVRNLADWLVTSGRVRR